MEKQKMKQVVLEILRNEKRTGKIVRTADVLDHITEVILSVNVDREYLQESIKEIINTNSKSILINPILSLFDLKIVRNKETRRIIESNEKSKMLDSLFTLNKKSLNNSIGAMVDSLAAFEKEVTEDHSSKVNKINELIDSLDVKRQEVNQLNIDAQAQLKTVANRLQHMLGLIGSQKTDSLLERELYELLTDLEIEVHWDSEGSPFNEAAMFTELITDDVLQHNVKPCLIKNGEILLQGLNFIEEVASAEETVSPEGVADISFTKEKGE